MAAPSKRTPQLEKALCDVLRAGGTRTAAVHHVGTTLEALRRWLARSVEFRASVAKAEAEAELRCTSIVTKAVIDGDVASARWWLERRRPSDWGTASRIDVVIRQQAERVAAELGLSADDVLAEAERIASRAAARG